MDYKMIDGTERISINMSSAHFGISAETLMRNMKAMGISIIKYQNVAYMSKVDFEEADRLDKSMIGLKDVISECINEYEDITVDFTNRESQAKYSELHSFFTGLNYFGITVRHRLISKPYNPIVFYINKDDKEQFKSKIVLKLKLYNKTKDEKLRILLEDDFFSCNHKTKTALMKLAKNSPRDMENAINELANFLRSTCKKEINQYNDEEISTYMEFAADNITKNANILFSNLIFNISQTDKCSFSIINQFDERVGVVKKDSSAYDDAVYLKLAYMVFNEEYWKEKDMLIKASDSKPLATTWLYHAMHYVCAWRKADIVNNIPHVTLNVEPDEIIRMVKEHDYSEATWIPYVNELVVRVGFESKKPRKSKRHENSPNLKMYIPESLRSTIGMLLALCEAHSILEGKGSPICRHPNNVKYADELFGTDYTSLFAGRLISNRKANKAYMERIMESGDKNNNNGYLLASYARSHKGGLGSLPEVTSKYLKAKMDGYSVDDITRILFERGVCSFVPYLLCSALYDNEFEKKHIDKQTETIKELGMIPHEIELLLQTDEKVELKAKQTISEIIKYISDENATEIVGNALKEIADGRCVGKNEDVYCIRKAFGEECNMPNREHCIGCGSEMYLKTFLSDLHNEIKVDRMKFENAKTKAERLKWKAILENKLYPAAYEVLTSMKYIYKQDITEYQRLFLGED
ncbi:MULTISPECIES: hypothetical protein [Paenibacillus]|uniref:hypothetical protein n=1 Tax=Paenibacillus TaxID=44249 RepID=UPI000953B016|nr:MULTISPECIES: hypothetical protein [Paenibacillus]ASS68159.1 hypothetical protein CIC07_19985 [Paenibacillus sp. RUD330]MEC0246359.1 hypothetical protein [Paenibacillus chitinolyticus]SIR69299.1 hypothetical protein SAMN05880555_4757 [Paenibacillus sp. RU4X]SIR76610.1 hypothetical protein SAMN05880570_4759 [Paenibacillus sp. RU4T]